MRRGDVNSREDSSHSVPVHGGNSGFSIWEKERAFCPMSRGGGRDARAPLFQVIDSFWRGTILQSARVRWGLGLALVTLLLVGCQTMGPLQPPSDSRVYEGQVRVSSDQESWIAEYLLELDPATEEFRLQLFKGGAVEMMEVAQVDEVFSVRSPFEGRSWRGSPGRLPGALQPWSVVGPAWAWADRRQFAPGEGRGEDWTATLRSSGPLRFLTVRHPGSGMEFRFSVPETTGR